jgi:hypothetical protein
MSLSRGPPEPTYARWGESSAGRVHRGQHAKAMDGPLQTADCSRGSAPRSPLPLCWPPLHWQTGCCALGAGQAGRTLKIAQVKPLKMSYKRREQGMDIQQFVSRQLQPSSEDGLCRQPRDMSFILLSCKPRLFSSFTMHRNETKRSRNRNGIYPEPFRGSGQS